LLVGILRKLDSHGKSSIYAPGVWRKPHTGVLRFIPERATMTARAVVFIDGNNWYHGLRSLGLTDLGRLDYAKISRKLVGRSRAWQATRYYVGQVNQAEAPDQYAAQRRFLSDLAAKDPRISYHLGRLETRVVQNVAADELLRMLNSLPVRIDIRVYKGLVALAQRHRRVVVKVEKAVDVQIAVDMVSLAQRDAYDAAYLLSADGDLTPAVSEVRSLGKKVFVASPNRGAQLAAAASAFIRVDAAWFEDRS